MNKKILFSLTFLLTGLVSSFVVNANYLSDWSNNDLCGWMESPSTIPEYILNEVDKREILCYGGIEVSKLPEYDLNEGENGTTFPSPDPALIKKALENSNSDYSNMY
tara:strand:+ start:121 stop:441 length:321 start_codon:yes stop_codon:yes gene_type:complete